MILHADPDALSAIAATIGRDWGHHGYTITELSSPVGALAALAEVTSADGGRFYVGSTRYGNTVYGEHRDEATRLLLERVKADRAP